MCHSQNIKKLTVIMQWLSLWVVNITMPTYHFIWVSICQSIMLKNWINRNATKVFMCFWIVETWFEALSEYFKLDTSNLILMGLLIYTNKKETDEKNKPYYNN